MEIIQQESYSSLRNFLRRQLDWLYMLCFTERERSGNTDISFFYVLSSIYLCLEIGMCELGAQTSIFLRQVQNSDRINSDRLIQVGSTRINPDRPGSTRIDLNLNTIKEKGCLIKEKGYFLRYFCARVSRIDSQVSSLKLRSRAHVLLSSAQYGWRRR